MTDSVEIKKKRTRTVRVAEETYLKLILFRNSEEIRLHQILTLDVSTTALIERFFVLQNRGDVSMFDNEIKEKP